MSTGNRSKGRDEERYEDKVGNAANERPEESSIVKASKTLCWGSGSYIW
jgi:hypothetical protein